MSRGSVLVFGAGELTLSGDVVLMFAKWMQEHRELARRGGRIDADVERWTDTAHEAARRTLSARRSAIGTSELPIGASEVPFAMLDPVDTEEARRLLRLQTTRGVVALIARKRFPSARMVAGRYLIERAEVIERAERTA